MLSKMRRRVKVIFFIVAASFIAGFLMSEVWQLIKSRGGGARHQVEAGVVGMFGKEKLGIDEYRQVLEYIGHKYRQDSLFRDLTNEDEIRIENLAWNYLIQEKNWQRILKETRLQITDGELNWIITRFPPPQLQNHPALMTDGKFDTMKYYQAMRNPENRPLFARYAREVYEQLRPQKLQMYVATAMHLNPVKIAEDLAFANTVVNITALYFGPKTFAEELKNFEPAPEELLKYYQKHKQDFTPKEEIRELAYVFFPLPVTALDSQSARERIEDVYRRLLAADSASFQDSFAMTALSLGDFDPDTVSVRFIPGQFRPETESIVRRLKPGQWTKPLATENGWQIILLDSAQADTFWIRRIRTRIKPDLTREMAVIDQARELIEQAKVAGFESSAVRLGLKISPMPAQVVEKKSAVFGVVIYNPTQLVAWAKEARLGDVTEIPWRAPGGFYVFALRKIIQPKPASFDEVKEVLKKIVRREKINELGLKKANEAIAQIKAGKSLEEYAGENPDVELIKKEVKGCFDNDRTIRGVEFVAAVLALEPGQTVGPIETPRGVYIIRCDGKRQSEEPILPQEHYLSQNQEGMFHELWEEVIKEPEIKDWRPLRSY